MKIILLALLAQPSFYGNWLSKPEYETKAAATYFVDPTGSDSGPCLGTGTAACLTVAGALAKVPKNIGHTITVNVAAGTYANSIAISGFTFLNNGTLTIAGPALTNATLGTGTATGTLTAVSNTTIPIATLTDSGQTWTTNALRGLILEITSGAANGQRRLIAKNTVTELSLAGALSTTPAPGDTYAIKTQAATFTAAIPLNVTRLFGGTNTINSVTVSNIAFAPASGLVCSFNGLEATITLLLSRCVSTGTTAALQIVNTAAPPNINGVYAIGTGTTVNANRSNWSLGNINTSGPSVFVSSTNNSALYTVVLSGRGAHANGPMYAVNTATTTNSQVVNITSGASAGNVNSQWIIECDTIGLPGLGISVAGDPFSTLGVANLIVSKCTNSVIAARSAIVNLTTAFALDNASAGLTAQTGGRFQFNNIASGNVSFSIVTNQLLLDSVDSYDFTDMNNVGWGIIGLSSGSGYVR